MTRPNPSTAATLPGPPSDFTLFDRSDDQPRPRAEALRRALLSAALVLSSTGAAGCASLIPENMVLGDLDRAVARHAQGVDLLLNQASDSRLTDRIAAAAEAAGNHRTAQMMRDVASYHATPVEAAESAAEAGAGHLLFHHIAPHLPAAPLERIFLKGAKDILDGEVTLGTDGTLISLPVEGQDTVDPLQMSAFLGATSRRRTGRQITATPVHDERIGPGGLM